MCVLVWKKAAVECRAEVSWWLCRAPWHNTGHACKLHHEWGLQFCSPRLTKMVVTINVRLANESVMLVDLSLLLSVMLRPL